MYVDCDEISNTVVEFSRIFANVSNKVISESEDEAELKALRESIGSLKNMIVDLGMYVGQSRYENHSVSREQDIKIYNGSDKFLECIEWFKNVIGEVYSKNHDYGNVNEGAVEFLELALVKLHTRIVDIEKIVLGPKIKGLEKKKEMESSVSNVRGRSF